MDELFPSIPEDVSSLTDDEISNLIAEAEAALDKVDAGDTGERSASEIFEQVKVGVEGLERLRGEAGTRAEAAQEQAEQMAELLARGRGSTDEPAAEGDETPPADDAGTETPAADADLDDDEKSDAEKEKDKIAVAASAAEVGVLAAQAAVDRILGFAQPKGSGGDRLIEAAQRNNERLRVGGTRDEHRPVAASTDVAIVASADVPGFPMGSPITDGLDIAKALEARFRNIGTSTIEGEKVPVVQMRWADGYPDERRLSPDMSDSGLAQRIREVVGDAPRGRATLEALTASGGLCAPVEIRYDLPVLAQADRPVRDSMPNFNATRGGIRFATPPSLASITTAVGRITAAADAAGGGGAVKACQVIACPPFVEVDVAAIYHCLQFGNLGARTFPELIENATELTMAAQARLAETALLDAMSAASIHATVALTPSNTASLGANAILLPSLLRAAAAQRSRQRMDPEAILDVQMPAWTLDLLTSDLARSAFDRFSQNDADLVRTMESYGLRVNFYWDGLTAVAQVFGAQANNAALLEFPPTVEFFMYPAGSFLLLDGGSLDLGLVRDSTLNRTNDYQIFAETWENIAFVGLESLRVSASVCDTGAVAAAVASVCGS